jgi:DNA-binding transcriptional ArsR family regulator
MASKREQAERRKSLRPHPARDQIVDVMRSYGQPLSPTQLSRITGGSLGSTAYHVRTLEEAGVVQLMDEGRVRGAVEHFYALVPGSPEDLQLVDPVMQLLGICGALAMPDPDGGYPRRAVVDDVARERLTTMVAELRPTVQQIVAEARARVDEKWDRRRHEVVPARAC